jgi:hypothetical protein
MDRKIYIITGHYGSGKSEFAVNFAYYLRNKNREVILADLDIVNPYFRSREVTTKLNNAGVDVIGDSLNSTKGLDMPYISASVQGAIASSSKDVILDCGGDATGIRVLKQFHDIIIKHNFAVYMIVNVFRPETSNAKQIMQMKDSIEQEANIRVTGFINNSNFIRKTTVEDIVYADSILKEVSKITNIPVIYVSGLKSVINSIPNMVSGEKFILDLNLRDNWL